jgi:hypothetical protein
MEIDDDAIEFRDIAFASSDEIEDMESHEGCYPNLDWFLGPIESTILDILADGFGVRVTIERTNLIEVRGFTSEGQ